MKEKGNAYKLVCKKCGSIYFFSAAFKEFFSLKEINVISIILEEEGLSSEEIAKKSNVTVGEAKVILTRFESLGIIKED